MFAADLVAKKIMVFYAGVTNAEAGEQAPYRWLGGFDRNASAVNGVQFAARQLKGETAKWSGDFTDEKRVFGAIHPERGIDWEFFTKTAKEEGVKLAPGTDLVYTVPLDSATASAGPAAGGADAHRQAQGRRRDDRLALHGEQRERLPVQGRRLPRLPPRVGLPRFRHQRHRDHRAHPASLRTPSR